MYSQCGFCNAKPPRGLGGNFKAYTLFMIDEWGREQVTEFMNLKGETKQYKIHDFIEIKEEYKQKLQNLLTFHA